MYSCVSKNLSLRRKLVAAVPSRPFAKWVEPAVHNLSKELVDRENELFAKLPMETQIFMKADRLALQRIQKEKLMSEDLWWNKLNTIGDEELDMLPHSFIKKFGTFVTKLENHEIDIKKEKSEKFNNRWEEVKNM